MYGVICFGMGLTLREGNREYFYNQLDRLFPGMKRRYMDAYGMRYEIRSPRHDRLMKLFHGFCADKGIVHDNGRIFTYLHTLGEEPQDQLRLF